MNRVGVFDTSNFINFPMGGIVSSIHNYLKYLENEESLKYYYLIGLTNNPKDEIGKIKKIIINNKEVFFFPVAYVDYDENYPSNSLRKLYLKGLLRNLLRIKKLKLDVLYLHTFEAFLALLFIGFKKKKIFFSHGNIYELFSHMRFKQNYFFKTLLKHYFTFMLRMMNYIFVLDKKTANEYILKSKNLNVLIVENSIDCSYYNFDLIEKKEQDILKIIFVGRLSKNKGISVIIRAIKELKNLNLEIIGVGEEYESLKNLIESENLNSKVKILGKKSKLELKEIYSKSDILIMNSLTEGTPMVILEAFASGLPVISTKVGNIPELIVEGYNGEFTNGTEESIYKKIIKIKKNLKHYKVNSRNSSFKYDFKKVNEKIFKVIS